MLAFGGRIYCFAGGNGGSGSVAPAVVAAHGVEV